MNEQNRISVLESPAARSPASTGIFVKGYKYILGIMPSLAVLGLLGAAAVWGHYTGWTLPKFSHWFGARSSAKDDWCAQHSVPESICVECNEALLPRIKSSWCRKHGVHNCPFERPEVAQVKETPVIAQEDLDRAQRALDLKDRPENSSRCKQHLRRIQFASENVLTRMGVDIALVSRGPIEETITASGEIVFAKPSVASVSIPVAGRVAYISEKGRLGAQVKKGDVLALVDALEVGKAKAELLQAFAQWELRRVTLDRLQPLYKEGAVPGSRMLEAETALREAKIRLLGAEQALSNLGLTIHLQEEKGLTTEELSQRIALSGIPQAIVKELPRTRSANWLAVLAPQDGTVTAAKVTVGEVVDPARALFILADTRQMWLLLNVRTEDVKYLRVRDPKTKAPGQYVRFRPDGSSNEVLGELVWKSTEVDEKTRTVQFQAVLPNPDGALLANAFGLGQVILRAEKSAIIVPSEAIHWEGDCHIVFVRDKNFFHKDGLKVFHVRSVRPGVKNGGNTELIAGLLPGEVVATRNSAALRAELLKNNLGAG